MTLQKHVEERMRKCYGIFSTKNGKKELGVSVRDRPAWLARPNKTLYHLKYSHSQKSTTHLYLISVIACTIHSLKTFACFEYRAPILCKIEHKWTTYFEMRRNRRNITAIITSTTNKIQNVQ